MLTRRLFVTAYRYPELCSVVTYSCRCRTWFRRYARRAKTYFTRRSDVNRHFFHGRATLQCEAVDGHTNVKRRSVWLAVLPMRDKCPTRSRLQGAEQKVTRRRIGGDLRSGDFPKQINFLTPTTSSRMINLVVINNTEHCVFVYNYYIIIVNPSAVGRHTI